MSWSAWHIVDAASQILSHMHDGSTQGSAGLPPKDLMQIPTFHIHTIPLRRVRERRPRHRQTWESRTTIKISRSYLDIYIWEWIWRWLCAYIFIADILENIKKGTFEIKYFSDTNKFESEFVLSSFALCLLCSSFLRIINPNPKSEKYSK